MGPSNMEQMQTKNKFKKRLRNLNSEMDENSKKFDVTLNHEKGIYDTHLWDKQYHKWVRKTGPKPSLHPDPDCLWN